MTDIKRVAIRKRAVDLLEGLTVDNGARAFRTVSSDLFRDLKPEELPLANVYWGQEVEDEEQTAEHGRRRGVRGGSNNRDATRWRVDPGG